MTDIPSCQTPTFIGCRWLGVAYYSTDLNEHIVEQVLGVAGVKLTPTQQMQCSIVGSQCRRGSEVARYLVERKSRFGVGAGDCFAWTVGRGRTPPSPAASIAGRRRRGDSPRRTNGTSSSPIDWNGPQCNRQAMGPALVAVVCMPPNPKTKKARSLRPPLRRLAPEGRRRRTKLSSDSP